MQGENEDDNLPSDCFTEQKLETTENELQRNVSTKSIILAPFNSTKTHISEVHDSVRELVCEKKFMMKFHARVREYDRQYENNNNGELDNGVYNKFVDNEIRNDDDGDKANEELVSNASVYSGRDGPQQNHLGRFLSSEAEDPGRNKDRHDLNENFSVNSNYNFVVDN